MKSKIKTIVIWFGVLIILSSLISCSTTPRQELYLPPKPYLSEEETTESERENYRKVVEWLIIFQETNLKELKKRGWL